MNISPWQGCRVDASRKWEIMRYYMSVLTGLITVSENHNAFVSGMCLPSTFRLVAAAR
jgi:hypothetical protein